MSNLMMILLLQKQFFEKKHYWGGSIIDCFEPIFRFLIQFWFKKHRSDTWNRIGMFSELSGHSDAKCMNPWKSKIFVTSWFDSNNNLSISWETLKGHEMNHAVYLWTMGIKVSPLSLHIYHRILQDSLWIVK